MSLMPLAGSSAVALAAAISTRSMPFSTAWKTVVTPP
jgi:hypothetical protein